MKKFTKRLIGLSIFFLLMSGVNSYSQVIPPSEFTIEADITVINKSVALIFGGIDKANLYMWQLNAEQTNFRLRPHVRHQGSWQTHYDVDASAAVPNGQNLEQHHLMIKLKGDSIISYINDIAIDTLVDSRMPKYGRIGIRMHPVDGENGTVDNIVVKDIKGNVLYANDFEENANEYPDCHIVSGELTNNAGVEFSLMRWMNKYTIDFDFKVKAYAAGFVFSAMNSDNLYMWQYNLAESYARFRPHKRINGGWSGIKDVDISAIISDEERYAEHHMRIDVQDTLIVTYFDGVIADTTVLYEFGFGTIGFRASLSAGDKDTSMFDNLVIRDENGNVLYENDCNSNPPFEFPDLKSVDGKIIVDGSAGEFVLRSLAIDQEISIKEITAPKAETTFGDTISVKLHARSGSTLKNVPIHYKVNNGSIVDEVVDTIGAFRDREFTFSQTHTFSSFPKIDTLIVWTSYSSDTVIVVQNGISVSTEILSVDAAAGSTAKFDITSVIDWTVASDQTWLTIDPALGTGNATDITVTAEENTTSSDRIATVTVEGGSITRKIVVTQSHNTTSGLELTSDIECSVFPNPSSGMFHVELGNNLNTGEIEIYNIVGKIVKVINIHQGVTDVDITNFEKGVYIVKVTSGANTYINKLNMQ